MDPDRDPCAGDSRDDAGDGLPQLAISVGHDLNNLVHMILANTAFVAEAVREDRQSLADLAHIDEAAQRIARLTRSLLRAARAADPRSVDPPQATDAP